MHGGGRVVVLDISCQGHWYPRVTSRHVLPQHWCLRGAEARLPIHWVLEDPIRTLACLVL